MSPFAQDVFLGTNRETFFSRVPAFRLAERWLNEATRAIETSTVASGETDSTTSLRRTLRQARSQMSVDPREGAEAPLGLLESLGRYLRVRDYRPSEVSGAFWLKTPSGEMPILAMPEGNLTPLMLRSKAHVLVGLAGESSLNPTATGFLYLPGPDAFRLSLLTEEGANDWLRNKRILVLDPWGLRVTLRALRCARETTEHLGDPAA